MHSDALVDEFISTVTLEDGNKLVTTDSDLYELLVKGKSPEHTDTGITDTASEVAEFMIAGSPLPSQSSLDSGPTLGQRNGKQINTDHMDMDSQDTATQSGKLLTPLTDSLPPQMPPDSRIKRDHKEVLSTEEESDNGTVKEGISRKKLREEEDGKQ